MSKNNELTELFIEGLEIIQDKIYWAKKQIKLYEELLAKETEKLRQYEKEKQDYIQALKEKYGIKLKI